MYTAANFLNSPAFKKIAVEDAIKLVAKTNKQTVEMAQLAYEMGVPNVISEVEKLVNKAAEHCATLANAGKLWK